MANFTGTTGDDVLVGTNADDTFDLSQGGREDASGRGGDDLFIMGATLNGNDTIRGGVASLGDTVVLEGDYSGGLKLKASTFSGIDFFEFIGGFSYDITLHEDNFTGGDAIILCTLGTADSLIFDASDDTDTNFIIGAGQGDDRIKGGQSGNDFELAGGGDDRVTGGDDSDDFRFGDTFDGGDRVDGGGGFDFVFLDGDYSAGVIITRELTGIERLEFGDGAYNLTLERDAIAQGQELGVQGGDSVVFDASATRGSFVFNSTLGDDVVALGAGDDRALVYDGTDEFDMGKGSDGVEVFSDLFDAASRIDGGKGGDIFQIRWAIVAATSLVMEDDTIRNFETIDILVNGFTLVMHDGNVAAGKHMHVSAIAVTAAVEVDASTETDGTYLIDGGGGNDTLTAGALADEIYGNNGNDTLGGREGDDLIVGGAGNDRLTGFEGADTLAGGTGADRLNGGFGADIYIISFAGESTGPDYDTAVSFNATVDKLQISPTIEAIDAMITTGSLSTGTFDAELGAVVDANHLAEDHAVLFDPDSGNLDDEIFLIIDANGQAGYQAGLDIVVQVTQASHLDQLSVDNFI